MSSSLLMVSFLIDSCLFAAKISCWHLAIHLACRHTKVNACILAIETAEHVQVSWLFGLQSAVLHSIMLMQGMMPSEEEATPQPANSGVQGSQGSKRSRTEVSLHSQAACAMQVHHCLCILNTSCLQLLMHTSPCMTRCFRKQQNHSILHQAAAMPSTHS